MPIQTEEGDFPRGGAKQKGKKRKLKDSEKDLFKTDNEEIKKKKSNTETIKPNKSPNEKKDKSKQKKKQNVDAKTHQNDKKKDKSKQKKNVDAKTPQDKKKTGNQTPRKEEKLNKDTEENKATGSKDKKKKKGKNKSKVQMKSNADGEANNKSPSGNKKKKRRNRKKKGGNKKAEKVENEKKEALGRVEKLHFARVEVGMHILGCIARVDEYSLTFDLPGGLQGEVPITAVSDTYTEQLKKLTEQDSDDEEEEEEGAVVPLSAMYQAGMMFPCRVAAIKIRSGSKKKIFLSMNPSVVNKDLNKSDIQEGQIVSGAVTASEEHGYMLDVGVSGTRSFLADKHVDKFIKQVNSGKPIHVGQVLRCQVLSVQQNLIKVGVNPHKLSKSQVEEERELETTAVQAGLQVTGTVKEVLKDGLSVMFNGRVGYVHRTHTTQYKHKKSFSPGQKVSATVLYTLNNNAIVYLSLLPHLVGSSCREKFDTLSALADRKTVHQVSALDALKKAVYFNMDGGLKALATLSNLTAVADYKIPLHKTFSFGTKHRPGAGEDSDSPEEEETKTPKKKKTKKEKEVADSKSSAKKRKMEEEEEAETPKTDKKSKKKDVVESDKSDQKKKKLDKEKEETDLKSSAKKKKQKSVESDDEDVENLTLSSKKKKNSGEDVEMEDVSSSKKKKNSKDTEIEETPSRKKKDTQLLSMKKFKDVSDSSDEDSSDDGSSEDIEMEDVSSKKKNKKETDVTPLKKKKDVSSTKNKFKDVSDSSEEDSDDSDSDVDVQLPSSKAQTSQTSEVADDSDVSDSGPDSDMEDSDEDSSDSSESEKTPPKKTPGKEKAKKKEDAETPGKKKQKGEATPGKKQKGETTPGKKQNGETTPGKKQKGEATPGKKQKGEATPGKKSPEETDSGVEVNKMSDSDEEWDLKTPKQRKNPARLSLSGGFSWSEDFTALRPLPSDDSSDEDTPDTKSVKKTGSELKKERMEEEKAIFAYERQQLEGGQAPMMSEDFDRLVLQSPNSSMVWTRYMAHHLETVEIDKARAVAERALKTISFREEQEKLNLWVAYLNLENMYGGTEQLKGVFDRALLQNEPIKVYKQMAQIYTGSDKMEEAEKLYNTMCKKFSQDKTVWTGFAQFFFRNHRLEPARKLLQRCLKCLENREHVEMISKFAQLEYRYGEAQRGCTMFENILTNYPKRTDLWSVYIDMVVKTGKMEEARSLFERVIHMKMSSKKMQFFFKKYLEFEKKHGDAKSVENVKQKAVDYVEAQGFTETE